MKRNIKKVVKLLSSALMVAALGFVPNVTANAEGAGITIDGDFSDWENVSKTSVDAGDNWGSVNEIASVMDDDYLYIYMSSTNGNASSMASIGENGAGVLFFTSETGEQAGIKFEYPNVTANVASIWNLGNLRGIGDAVMMVDDNDWHQDGTPHRYEIAVPRASLPAGGVSISIGKYKADGTAEAMITVEPSGAAGGDTPAPEPTAEPTPTPAPTEEPVPTPEPTVEPVPTPDPTNPPSSYNGITIDGDFSDWNGVNILNLTDSTDWGQVNRFGTVWDGDYLYMYLESFSDNGASLTGAGNYGNGKFAVSTDLGNQMLFQVSINNGQPTILGNDGATCKVNTLDWASGPYKWEIAIPTDSLPNYMNTISVGLYDQTPFVSDLANLNPVDNGDDKNFSGIVIDGLYGDWEYFPHHDTTQYSTSGTGSNKVDGKAAVYTDTEAGKIYTHAATSMEAHLNENGSEMLYAVTLKVNNDFEFTPRFVTIENGQVNYSPNIDNLSAGTHVFYMVDIAGWGNLTKEELDQGDVTKNAIYGKVYVTVAPGQHDCEAEYDMEMLAKKAGVEPENLKQVSVKYGRIGDQWITTAGTSTGTWIGIALSLLVVGVVELLKRKKA